MADVDYHLALLTVGDGLIEMVKNKEVAATTAVALVREHGMGCANCKTQLEKAKATGKTKLTRAAAMPQFSAARARELVDLMKEAEHTTNHQGENVLWLPSDNIMEVMKIVAEYRQQLKGAIYNELSTVVSSPTFTT